VSPMSDAAKMAIDFESSFAGVRKTVNATGAEFSELAQGFRDLAKTIPIRDSVTGEELRMPGRPRGKEAGSSISTWVSVSEHNRLIALAKARRQSVSSLLSELLRRTVLRQPTSRRSPSRRRARL
jgi:hypothetical protein